MVLNISDVKLDFLRGIFCAINRQAPMKNHYVNENQAYVTMPVSADQTCLETESGKRRHTEKVRLNMVASDCNPSVNVWSLCVFVCVSLSVSVSLYLCLSLSVSLYVCLSLLSLSVSLSVCQSLFSQAYVSLFSTYNGTESQNQLKGPSTFYFDKV